MSRSAIVARTGAVVAILLAGWHLCWSLLVALGFAQPVIDFIFWIHFIKPVYVIEPFSLGRAALLVALTGGIGFAVGALLAAVWNALHRP